MINYYEASYFILIFLIFFVTFYVIITNFNYTITINPNNIESTIENIKTSITNINDKINNSQTDNFRSNIQKTFNDDSDNQSIDSLKQEISSYKKTISKKNNFINKLKQKNRLVLKSNLSKKYNNYNTENQDTYYTNSDNEDNITDESDNNEDQINYVVNKNNNDNQNNSSLQNTVVFDPIANYDNAKLIDPLVDPLQRTSADQIPNPSIAMQLNFPTQGILDKYHRVGLLIAIDSNLNNDKIIDNNNIIKRKQNSIVPVIETESERTYKGVWLAEKGKIEGFDNITTNDENSILELIGKRRYHNVYRYYTSISMGNKIIKIMVNNKNNKEFYSGDLVYIKELNKNYRVEIDNTDMIDYNPYVF